MDSSSEGSGTKLPEIRNNTHQNEGSRGGAKSGRTENMSHNSSRKSLQVRSMRQKRTLKDAKQERQQVEKDAELLANRIALLKQEEIRTWKKIEETRKRARDVIEMKRKNEVRIKEKTKQIYANQKREQKLKEQRKIYREQRNKEKGKIKDAIKRSKQMEAKMIKEEERRNMRVKSEMRKRYWDLTHKKSTIVKEQHKIAEEKRKEYEKIKLEEAKKEFDQKINKEVRMTKQKEKEVMQMEMIEMELIKKLQNTQNIQKDAYKELENALAQPTIKFNNR